MIRRNIAALGVALCAILASGLAFSQLEDEIRERISPAGSVCVAGEPCASGVASTGSSGGGESGSRSPEEIYQVSCTACHGTGANEAPVLGNSEQWAPRIDKGMDVLYDSAINGMGDAMPARGLCADCSDEELREVVDYMVAESE